MFWGYPPPPHDYPHYWVILDPKSKEDKVKVTNIKNLPKFQIFEFWNKHNTFSSCLTRCANMKWIQWVLLKIQSGHDSAHRRTDRQMDKVKPVYPLTTLLKWGYSDVHSTDQIFNLPIAMKNYFGIYIHVNKPMCYPMTGKSLYYNLDSMLNDHWNLQW